MKIAIWTGAYQYWDSVHPKNLIEAKAPQMGGSEAAALSIARCLAERGHDVLLGCKVAFAESFGNLRICPLDMFPLAIYTGAYDVLVAWDEVGIFRYNLEHIPTKFLVFQLNDAQVGLYDHVITKYFHPSQWHADRFVEKFGVPKEKQVVGLTNGVDPRMLLGMPTRQQHVVWASSPDRGLHHVLRMWPKVLEQVPEAHLHVYYDMDKWLAEDALVSAQGHRSITHDHASRLRKLLAAGVPQMTYHGGVAKVEVALALLRAKVMAYTCEPVAPTEGFSMTTLESWIAGCQVIISDADALSELWGWREGVTCLPLPIDDDIWVDAIVKGLQMDIPTGPRLVPEALSWAYKAQQWEEACLTR